MSAQPPYPPGPGYGPPQPGYGYQPPAKKSGTNPLLIVLIVLGTLIVLGIGGCVACAAVIGGTAKEIDKSITDELNKNSITNEQARQIEIGATRREVEQTLGPPQDTQEGQSEGLGNDSCIYYNVRDGGLGDQWQFCFDGDRQDGKLRNKQRY